MKYIVLKMDSEDGPGYGEAVWDDEIAELVAKRSKEAERLWEEDDDFYELSFWDRDFRYYEGLPDKEWLKANERDYKKYGYVVVDEPPDGDGRHIDRARVRLSFDPEGHFLWAAALGGAGSAEAWSETVNYSRHEELHPRGRRSNPESQSKGNGKLKTKLLR